MDGHAVHNRVKERYLAGEAAYGVHIKLPAAAEVDIAGASGFDFVKFDPYHWNINPETLEHMIGRAYSHDITPWVRCRNDPWEIMKILDMGAQALSIPKCSSAAYAAAAASAMFYPPKGRRESNRPLRFRGMTDADYFEWASNQLVLCVSIEDQAGVDSLDEIVKVDGVDVIATGRGDLSLALGVDNDRNHPKVLQTQKRILATALDAGKQVSFTCATTQAGIEEGLYWKEQGARILTFEAEYRVLLRAYGEALTHLRNAQL